MPNNRDGTMFDALVIGGGPAGLTAALYLARFRLSVLIADDDNSRTALIAKSHNQPFWPRGVSGHEILSRMREQLTRYPVETLRASVDAVSCAGLNFAAVIDGKSVQSRAVILATGVSDHRPLLSESDHAEALQRGLLRYCPICDGYEIIDRNIAVVGRGDRLYGEAKFLRSYTAAITVFPQRGDLALSGEQRAELDQLGIDIVDACPVAYVLREHTLEVVFEDRLRVFDSMYAALGSNVRSALAVGVGARVTGDGCVIVDSHQRTSVTGLYAAGDVVVGVDQIGHAVGQATVAATTLRNDLCHTSQGLSQPIRRSEF